MHTPCLMSCLHLRASTTCCIKFSCHHSFRTQSLFHSRQQRTSVLEKVECHASPHPPSSRSCSSSLLSSYIPLLPPLLLHSTTSFGSLASHSTSSSAYSTPFDSFPKTMLHDDEVPTKQPLSASSNQRRQEAPHHDCRGWPRWSFPWHPFGQGWNPISDL